MEFSVFGSSIFIGTNENVTGLSVGWCCSLFFSTNRPVYQPIRHEISTIGAAFLLKVLPPPGLSFIYPIKCTPVHKPF